MIAGLHFVRSAGKAGVRWYVYAWRGGPCIMKSDGPRKPKLDAAALAALAAASEDSRAIRPDMLGGLAREWRGNPAKPESGSPEWRGLEAGTKKTWGAELDRIEERWGETPLAVWNDPRMKQKIVAWRDSRAQTPRAADIGVTVLGELLKFGCLRARLAINVANGIPSIYQPIGREEIIWTDDDVERFCIAAMQLDRPHMLDGLWLALLTGMRRFDLVDLRWGEVGEHAIIRVAQKKSRGRRRRAVIPILPELRTLLDELRTRPRLAGVDTVLTSSRGTPWGHDSFTQRFNEVRDAAGIVEPGNERLGLPPRRKHLHDCRGTFVTKLCRARLTDEEIAGIAAWSKENVARIRRTYVDDAAIVVALGERIRNGL